MEHRLQNTIIEDNSLVIKKLELEDALKIKSWGRHSNKLFIDYDLAKYNQKELKIWYYSKKSGIRNKYFAIYNYNNDFIGYIGIKDINIFKKSSTLGIVLNPSFISKGYGYKAMCIFLDYYFNEMNMKRMNLEVNEFNERAIKLYKKLGFRYVSEYLGMFENQNINFDEIEYIKYRDNFVVNNGIIYSKIHIMTLDYRRYKLKEQYNEI
ncbi:GNAT family N-acetyltransferase [Miniphocaeibacter halophilus]|uniref:GNAT family N-acetyltransferase n=1 Tax=Miniphocaeibacter halophilus TaxID=2931922 RepID=A0AC61N5S1_9FIRM|nr:GNAT family N-acetyltransferase [Miniphocaeibacter halophilus]QQK08063.1 GNAT family N-acetyltransferase [Miniphocaeibacter halophilus]